MSTTFPIASGKAEFVNDEIPIAPIAVNKAGISPIFARKTFAKETENKTKHTLQQIHHL
jgi:hypothetical protein